MISPNFAFCGSVCRRWRRRWGRGLLRRSPDVPAGIGHHYAHHVAGGPTVSHGVECHFHLVAWLNRSLRPTASGHLSNTRHLEAVIDRLRVRRPRRKEEPTVRVTPFQLNDGAFNFSRLAHVEQAE